jgi:hypothetical protein
MFLVDPKVFRFVVKGTKAILLGVQRGWGLLLNPMGNLKFRTLKLLTSNWIMIQTVSKRCLGDLTRYDYNLTIMKSPEPATDTIYSHIKF